MASAVRYRIDSPKVIHQTIDGELVIIHHDTGSYYSLDHVGADIWNLLTPPAAAAEIVEEMTARYEGERETIERAVCQLLDELGAHDLIVAEDRNVKPASNGRSAGGVKQNGAARGVAISRAHI